MTDRSWCSRCGAEMSLTTGGFLCRHCSLNSPYDLGAKWRTSHLTTLDDRIAALEAKVAAIEAALAEIIRLRGLQAPTSAPTALASERKEDES